MFTNKDRVLGTLKGRTQFQNQSPTRGVGCFAQPPWGWRNLQTFPQGRPADGPTLGFVPQPLWGWQNDGKRAGSSNDLSGTVGVQFDFDGGYRDVVFRRFSAWPSDQKLSWFFGTAYQKNRTILGPIARA